MTDQGDAERPDGSGENGKSAEINADGPGKKSKRRRRNYRRLKGTEKKTRDGSIIQTDDKKADPNGSASTGVGMSAKFHRRRKRAGKPDSDGQIENRLEKSRVSERQDNNVLSGAGPDGDDAAKKRAANPRKNTALRPGQNRDGQSRSNTRHARRNPEWGGKANARSGSGFYAALDLGTNNCRLLVAEPQAEGFRVVDAFSRIVRLGEGIGASGSLGQAAMDRAIAALRICRSKLDSRKVTNVRLIATEACRIASNGEHFLDRVQKEAGLKLEIVDRETEARLAVSGCASLIHPKAEGVLLFDIGGGSSELVWLDMKRIGRFQTSGSDDKNADNSQIADETTTSGNVLSGMAKMQAVRSWASLPLGVVTLSEHHGGHDVTRESYESMVTHVRSQLHLLDEGDALREAMAGGRMHMLGTSGTVTTLAGVFLGLRRYDRRRVDGTWLSIQQLTAMIDRILEMDFSQRVANPCIGEDRADLVLAGCAILDAFMREWPCKRLRVADRGLREGILMELMTADGVWDKTAGDNKRNSNQNRPRNRHKSRRRHRPGQIKRPGTD